MKAQEDYTAHSGPTGITITDPDVKITLAPVDGAATKVKLIVDWQGTSLQEQTNQVSVTLETTQLQAFFKDLNDIATHGEASGVKRATIGPDELTFSPGVATRPDGVVAKLTSDLERAPESTQSMNVTFHKRGGTENGIDFKATRVPLVEFSKEDFLGGLEYTEDWRLAWQRAIALAWSNDALKKLLLSDPFLFFKEHCNYALPPTVNLAVVDMEAVTPKHERSGSEWGFIQLPGDPNWKWILPRSVLIMFLPPHPKEPENHAIALNAYDAVGKSYPFTVSC